MVSPYITDVTEKNFEAEVIKSDKLVLIDFWAEWCGPCKAMMPTLEKFAEDNQATVKVVKVNVDEAPELAKAFGVRGIPFLVTMKDGAGLLSVVGNVPRKALDKLVQSSFKRVSNQSPKPPSSGPKL